MRIILFTTICFLFGCESDKKKLTPLEVKAVYGDFSPVLREQLMSVRHLSIRRSSITMMSINI